MAITFQNIPGNIRVPFFYGEVRAGAQGFQQNSVLLLIGLMTPIASPNPGAALLDNAVQVFGNEDFLFGRDSPLAQMVKIARLNAPFQSIAALPVTNAGGAVKATGTFTVTGTAARSATGSVYVNGARETFVIVSGDTNSAIATKIAAAINADIYAPVVAVAAVGVVTCTAKVAGTFGNTIKLAVGIRGDDDPLAASMIVASAMTTGAGDPSISAALANLGDVPYDFIAMMFSDTTNVGLLESFLSDINGRWGPYSQSYGHAFWGKDETLALLATDGLLHNSQHCTFFGQYNYNTPPYLSVAARAAIASAHLQSAPEMSSPLQTLPVAGVMGPTLQTDRPTISERQTLYYDGVTMDRFDDFTGQCQLDRVITTYNHNAWGSPDITFLDINTLAQVQHGMRRIKADMTQNMGRAALADTNPFNVSNIVTPADVKAQLVHSYRSLCKEGVFENPEIFAENLQVERDVNDPNRVNGTLPFDTVNQLVIMAVAGIVYLQTQSVQGS